jgi:hypothetical protein
MKHSLAWFFCAVLALCSSASADLYSFARITSNSSTILNQLSVDVTAAGGNRVNFTFKNNVGAASSITGIYFDDDAGVLASIKSLTESSGVDFSTGGSPPDLPSGTNIGFSSQFRATANPPPSSNGISTSAEYLTIKFDLAGGKAFGDVLAALESQSIRIGLHVQALPDGKSDSYVTKPPTVVVPSPNAAFLGLIGLALLGFQRGKHQYGRAEEST